MIVCHNKDDYELLVSLRSLDGRVQIIKVNIKELQKYPKLDPRYIFINQGFNLRPTDVQAAMGLNQFKRLSKFIILERVTKK